MIIIKRVFRVFPNYGLIIFCESLQLLSEDITHNGRCTRSDGSALNRWTCMVLTKAAYVSIRHRRYNLWLFNYLVL